MRTGDKRGLDGSLSGCSLSARATPGRPGRGGFLAGSGRFGFLAPRGGGLELSWRPSAGSSRRAWLPGSPITAQSGRRSACACASICVCCARDQGDQLITGEGEKAAVWFTPHSVGCELGRDRVKQNLLGVSNYR